MHEATRQAFKREIENIDSNLDLARRLDAVNLRLKKYNWIFIGPYHQGGHVLLLNEILDQPNPEQRILDIFAGSFLGLHGTIHLIDGLFRKRPFLADYTDAVEESVLLCLQHDFRAAINIILPITEATLRKFLVAREGEEKKSEIKMSKLLGVTRAWRTDHRELQRKYLRKQYEHLDCVGLYFDSTQEKRILDRNDEYFNIWISQLENYLEQNLYKPTQNEQITDTFNRHVMTHLFDEDIEFSFSNYLRLFNCICYLSWAIGMVTENSPILSVADEEEVNKKWYSYMKILATSEALIDVKSEISGKKVESFRPYLQKAYQDFIDMPVRGIKDSLMFIGLYKRNYALHTPGYLIRGIICFILLKFARRIAPKISE